MKNISQNQNMRDEINPIIEELEKKGIKHNDYYTVGLGDAIEEVLNKFGVTQDRFKSLLNLKECLCNERKKWLNGIFYWHRKKLDD